MLGTFLRLIMIPLQNTPFPSRNHPNLRRGNESEKQPFRTMGLMRLDRLLSIEQLFGTFFSIFWHDGLSAGSRSSILSNSCSYFVCIELAFLPTAAVASTALNCRKLLQTA